MKVQSDILLLVSQPEVQNIALVILVTVASFTPIKKMMMMRTVLIRMIMIMINMILRMVLVATASVMPIKKIMMTVLMIAM